MGGARCASGCAAVALLVLCVAAAVSAQQPEPLLPPNVRLERSLALEPLHARKHPMSGEEFVEPVRGPILPQPTTQEVDFAHTWLGNSVTHRQYMDFPERMQVVLPNMAFPGSGKISKWQVYTGRDCLLQVQVFRAAPIPRALDQNKEPVHSFTLVGTNVLNVTELGMHEFEVPPAKRISVKAGDVMGFYTDSPGCVSWSTGGPPVVYRYGFPGHNELKAFKSVVLIGEGLQRSYSLACFGNFSHLDLELDAHPSPPPSVSPPPSETSSNSPSNSPSTTPSFSSIPSITASTSPSASATETPSPSVSPSIYPSDIPRKMLCSRGVTFWCASPENMQLCNMTAELCEALMEALYPPLPSPFPSGSPIPSTTPSVSPTIVLGPNRPSALPSPTPSMSLVPPPYEPQPAGGLTKCNYCNGGADWSTGVCSTGTQQSPITIKFDSMDVEPALNLYFAVNYNITRATLAWSDFAFTLTAPDLGLINIDGVNYKADMAVIRAPSEHKLEGARTPMEMQIFHHKPGTNPPEVLAVSVLFEETTDAVESLDWIFEIPEAKTPKTDVVLDLENFLSDQKPLAFYSGSMTQPPCQEGITWAVSMGDSAKISSAQVEALNKFMKNDPLFAGGRGNNRLTQPLNGRRVTLRSNCGISGAMECGGGGAASADMVSEADGGSAQNVQQALEAEKTRLSAAAQREKEISEMLGEDGGDMFDDGDVKLW